jgi:hypothetical protein
MTLSYPGERVTSYRSVSAKKLAIASIKTISVVGPPHGHHLNFCAANDGPRHFSDDREGNDDVGVARDEEN